MRITRIPKSVTLSAGRGRARLARTRRRALTVAVLAALAVLAIAAGPASAQSVAVLAIVTSLDQVINNARNWLIGILAGVATICLTVAGVRYVIASGDPAEIEKAKAALRAACLGYVLAMLAPVIVSILKSIVGA
ncbi:pilin [Nocardia jiangxiensis]|uniref:Pilin n=1 Tax=Nocardia jiangxiensis TaxID=282685 RepID=A0ABW6RS56_9NOCA